MLIHLRFAGPLSDQTVLRGETAADLVDAYWRTAFDGRRFATRDLFMAYLRAAFGLPAGAALTPDVLVQAFLDAGHWQVVREEDLQAARAQGDADKERPPLEEDPSRPTSGLFRRR